MSGIGDIRERRKQRILGNSEERMKKLMGINEKLASEFPRTLKPLEKEEKVESKADDRFRKISFGNMVSNNKMAEKLRKERKISLNLERIWPINEELSDIGSLRVAGGREFEREIGSRRVDVEMLKEVKRPQLKGLEHPQEMRYNTEIPKKEFAKRMMEEEMKDIDEQYMDIEDSDEEELSIENDCEGEGFNEMEGRLLIENYETKLRSLEEFARRIEDDGKESKRPVKLMAAEKEKETDVEEEKPLFPATPPSSSSSRSIFMLVLGVLCRLFITLLPLIFQNIFIIFVMIELMIASYQYFFKTRTPSQASPHFIISTLLGLMGVSKEVFRKWNVWMGRVAKGMGDLCTFLFSFLLLHHFLYDPLACDFDAR